MYSRFLFIALVLASSITIRSADSSSSSVEEQEVKNELQKQLVKDCLRVYAGEVKDDDIRRANKRAIEYGISQVILAYASRKDITFQVIQALQKNKGYVSHFSVSLDGTDPAINIRKAHELAAFSHQNHIPLIDFEAFSRLHQEYLDDEVARIRSKWEEYHKE